MTELKAKVLKLGEDYPEICEWWRARGWHWVPCELLPPTGVVIYDENEKHCAGWIYLSYSGLACMDWIVTNPKASLRQKKPALELLVKSLQKIGAELGASRVFTSTNNENLVSIYESCGFSVTERQMTNLSCEVSK